MIGLKKRQWGALILPPPLPSPKSELHDLKSIKKVFYVVTFFFCRELSKIVLRISLLRKSVKKNVIIQYTKATFVCVANSKVEDKKLMKNNVKMEMRREGNVVSL